MTEPLPLCDCREECRLGCPADFKARCQGVDPTLPPAERHAAAYSLRVSLRGPLPAFESSDSDAERAAELRHAERTRCAHRGATPIRQEPCHCPVIQLLPIYRCELLQCDCSDIRAPAAPAVFCCRCQQSRPT